MDILYPYRRPFLEFTLLHLCDIFVVQPLL